MTATVYNSQTIGIYLKSASARTQGEMAKLTGDQLRFADDVYKWAEHHYDTGGDRIVECYEPWAIVQNFSSLRDAKEACGILHDYAEDVRNA